MQDSPQSVLRDQIARVAQGDRHAFEALYQATSARLNAICLSVLKDRREAEEALEQVYIDIWRNARGFAEGGLSPMAWLVGLARDGAVDHRQKRPAPAALAFANSRPDQDGDAVGLVRIAYLEGLDYPQLAERQGMTAEEARHRLHEGLERLAGHAADGPDRLAAAEQALGLRSRAGQQADKAQVADWQERLARLAGDLTPVMAPARARQRIRESLGHGVAPLSVDPLERTPWWRSMGGMAAILLVAALGLYLWMT